MPGCDDKERRKRVRDTGSRDGCWRVVGRACNKVEGDSALHNKKHAARRRTDSRGYSPGSESVNALYHRSCLSSAFRLVRPTDLSSKLSRLRDKEHPGPSRVHVKARFATPRCAELSHPETIRRGEIAREQQSSCANGSADHSNVNSIAKSMGVCQYRFWQFGSLGKRRQYLASRAVENAIYLAAPSWYILPSKERNIARRI
jgi:hypothetical protein